MGRVGSSPEFHVNFGLGRVGSLHLWVGLVGVKKMDPRPTLTECAKASQVNWRST